MNLSNLTASRTIYVVYYSDYNFVVVIQIRLQLELCYELITGLFFKFI
jgi:hypothetical protein